MVVQATTCQQITRYRLDELTKRIEMHKGPCFGTCPVFRLTIYDNGLATYDGERFTNRVGTFIKKLDQRTLNELLTAFRNVNLFQYNDVYPAQIPDLQTVTITYYEEDREKTIRGKDGRPAIIEDLEAMLDEIANSGGWEPQNENSYVADNAGAAPQSNEIIVQLADNVRPEVFVVQYRDYRMEVKEQVSPDRNFWVVTFDPETIAPSYLLNQIRRNQFVLSAQFNQRVQGR